MSLSTLHLLLSLHKIPVPLFRTQNENVVFEGNAMAYVHSDKNLCIHLNFVHLFWELQYAQSSDNCPCKYSVFLFAGTCLHSVFHQTHSILFSYMNTQLNFQNFESHFDFICDLEIFSYVISIEQFLRFISYSLYLHDRPDFYSSVLSDPSYL